MSDWLVDTNPLVILMQPHIPEYGIAQAAIRKLLIQGHELWIAPQTISEFYSTLTRPVRLDASGNPKKNSGLGYSSTDALAEVAALEMAYNLLEDDPGIYREWKNLIAATNITGNQCYDVRLAAIMRVYGITDILTFNTADFLNIPGINAINPNNI